jgi:hypothetical protein
MGPGGPDATVGDYPAFMEYIPLARAAALVHEKLFPEEKLKETKTLDLLALALSTVTPLYQRDDSTGEIRPLTAEEIAEGIFTRGATRIEYPDRPTLRFLVVRREAVDGAIKALVDDPLVAGRVSLTLRQGSKSADRGAQAAPTDRRAS